MKKIVLCNGDSLGMPRQDVNFKSSWFYRLVENKPEYIYINNFKRSLTTNDLYSHDYLEHYQPNIVILQVGIVDCAPRFFNNSSLLMKVVKISPKYFRKVFWKIAKKLKSRTSANADVPIVDFKRNLEQFVERALKTGVEKIIVIKILTPGQQMIIKNPSIIKSIELYNRFFDELNDKYNNIITINPLYCGLDKYYVSDGYHLNEKGYDKVYQALIPLI